MFSAYVQLPEVGPDYDIFCGYAIKSTVENTPLSPAVRIDIFI